MSASRKDLVPLLEPANRSAEKQTNEEPAMNQSVLPNIAEPQVPQRSRMRKAAGSWRLAACALALLPGVACAELYCVTNATQLVNAFAAADASPGASEIRVATGSYTVTASGSQYALRINGEGDVLLTGGWAAANNCQTRSTLNPEQTILTTGGSGKLLFVSFPFERAAVVEISGIAFRNSSSSDVDPACLKVVSEYNHGTRNQLFVDRNSFRLCSNFVSETGPSSVGIDTRYTDTYLRNNVFADNAGFDSVVRVLARTEATTYISNNTIAFNPSAPGGQFRWGLIVGANNNSSFYWIFNNVGSNNGGPEAGGSDFRDSSGFAAGVVSHNLFRRISEFPNMAYINNLTSDPMLASSVDLRVTAASPLRNSGATPTGGALAFDLQGLARVQGGRIDRGAHEFEELFINGFE